MTEIPQVEVKQGKRQEIAHFVHNIPGFDGLTVLIRSPKDRLQFPPLGTAAKATAVLVVAGVATMAALPFFDRITGSVVAAQQVSAESFRGDLKRTENLQVIQDHIEFNIGSDHITWDWTNAGLGINPPNDFSIRTGTIRVAINNTWVDAKSFQGLQSLYPKPLGALVMGGMAVDGPSDMYYLATATIRNDGNYDFYLESGVGIRTPESYTGRKVTNDGLPTEGFYGTSSQYLTLGQDDKGKWLNMMVDNCANSAKNGTYQWRLDEQGNIIEGVVKISNSITPNYPYQIFVPQAPRNFN